MSIKIEDIVGIYIVIESFQQCSEYISIWFTCLEYYPVGIGIYELKLHDIELLSL